MGSDYKLVCQWLLEPDNKFIWQQWWMSTTITNNLSRDLLSVLEVSVEALCTINTICKPFVVPTSVTSLQFQFVNPCGVSYIGKSSTTTCPLIGPSKTKWFNIKQFYICPICKRCCFHFCKYTSYSFVICTNCTNSIYYVIHVILDTLLFKHFYDSLLYLERGWLEMINYAS